MQNYFDHEKLEVYQVELAFLTWLTPLLTKVKASGVTSRSGEVLDQLDRTSLSAPLNTAEDNGRRQRQTRAKFFDDARGLATECERAWTPSSRSGSAKVRMSAKARKLLLRTVSILSKLIDRFDQRPNDEEGTYGDRTEDEDE